MEWGWSGGGGGVGWGGVSSAQTLTIKIVAVNISFLHGYFRRGTPCNASRDDLFMTECPCASNLW